MPGIMLLFTSLLYFGIKLIQTLLNELKYFDSFSFIVNQIYSQNFSANSSCIKPNIFPSKITV